MNCWRLILLAWVVGVFPVAAKKPGSPAAGDFFGLTNVWSIHLKLSSADWQLMEPPVRPRGPGDPEGPGEPRSRPESARPESVPPPRRENAPLNSRDIEPRPGPPGENPRPDPNRRASGNGPGMRPPGPMHLDFSWVTGTIEFENQVLTNVAVRFKGNSSFNGSRNSLKKPFKLDFDRHVAGRTFFGLEELFLNNNVNELAHLREPLAYDAFRRAGLPAPRTAFVRLYLTVTGQFERRYVGLYTAVEPVEGDFIKRTLESKKGLLVKPEGIRGLEYFGDDWRRYTNRYEVKNDFTVPDARRLVALARFVNQSSDAEFGERLASYLDVDATLRFVALNALLANLDSFLGNGHNYYLFLPRKSGRASFIPWDLNEAFGGHPMAGDNRAQAELSILNPAPPGNRLVARLLAQPALALRYRQICESLLTNAFNASRLIADVEKITAATREGVAEDPNRRGLRGGPSPGARTDRPESARPESARPDRRGPEANPPGSPTPRGPDPRRPNAMALAEWIQLRDANVREELAGRRTGTVPSLGRNPGGPPPRPN